MPRPLALTKRPARPTVAEAYSIGRKLTSAQRVKLINQLRRSLRDEVNAAAEQVQARMEADGVFITEADIDAEVQAVRAMMYAEGHHQ